MPKLWIYARVSDGELQIDSIDRQIELLMPRIHELVEAGTGTWDESQLFTEDASGSKIEHNNRPQFAKLMGLMEPGDTLLVWAVSRIDRNPFALFRAMEFFIKRSITLISLRDMGGMTIDMSKPIGMIVLSTIAFSNQLWLDFHSGTAREEAKRRIANEQPHGTRQPWGMKKVYAPHPYKETRNVPKHVVDEDECRFLAQLVYRHDNGESFLSIAKELYAKNAKRASGQVWVYKSNTRHLGYSYPKLRKAYDWTVKHVRENNGKLRGFPIEQLVPSVPPSLKATVEARVPA